LRHVVLSLLFTYILVLFVAWLRREPSGFARKLDAAPEWEYAAEGDPGRSP
jgi:hypothetical protein